MFASVRARLTIAFPVGGNVGFPSQSSPGISPDAAQISRQNLQFPGLLKWPLQHPYSQTCISPDRKAGYTRTSDLFSDRDYTSQQNGGSTWIRSRPCARQKPIHRQNSTLMSSLAPFRNYSSSSRNTLRCGTPSSITSVQSGLNAPFGEFTNRIVFSIVRTPVLQPA